MITARKINLLIIFSFLFLAVKMPFDLIHAFVWIIKPVYVITEFLLDEMISRAFGTDSRTTEVIVFYLMWSIGALIAYVLFEYVRYLWTQAKTEIPVWWSDQTTRLKTSWQTSPLIKKSKVVFSIALGGSCMAILALN